MDDLISRKKLLEQTAEWEAAALEQVGKLDPKEDPENWIRWSAVLQERTAFKHDVQDAPAEHPELHEWCTDCKEYDQEKRCCPRFNRVILETLTEMQKTGKWIKTGRWGRVYKCNQCGNFLDFDGVNVGRGSTNFCPNCGAKMENSDE